MLRVGVLIIAFIMHHLTKLNGFIAQVSQTNDLNHWRRMGAQQRHRHLSQLHRPRCSEGHVQSTNNQALLCNQEFGTDLSCISAHTTKRLSGETLSSIIPKDTAVAVLRELKSNDSILHTSQEQYNTLWTNVILKLREERRSIVQVVGGRAHNRILDFVEGQDPYDPQAVQTFLQTPVFENMLGSILYEGIFEFLKRVDIIGNVMNKLPIIGPIKVAIDREFKKSLDRTVGVQIKSFLATFNRTAVQRMVDFVLSPSNRAALRRANRNAADVVLNRPLSQLLPTDAAKSDVLKKQIWNTISNTSVDDLLPAINFVYSSVGDTPLDTLLHPNFTDVLLGSSSKLQSLLERNVRRYLESDDGRQAVHAVKRILS